MGLEGQASLNPQDFLSYVAGINSIIKSWTEPSSMDMLAAQQGFQSQEAEATRQHAVNLENLRTKNQTDLAMLNNLLTTAVQEQDKLQKWQIETSKLGVDTSGMDWMSFTPDMEKVYNMVGASGQNNLKSIREEMQLVVDSIGDNQNKYINFLSDYNRIKNEAGDFGESTFLPQYSAPNLWDAKSNQLIPGGVQGQLTNEDFRLMGITALSDILTSRIDPKT